MSSLRGHGSRSCAECRRNNNRICGPAPTGSNSSRPRRVKATASDRHPTATQSTRTWGLWRWVTAAAACGQHPHSPTCSTAAAWTRGADSTVEPRRSAARARMSTMLASTGGGVLRMPILCLHLEMWIPGLPHLEMLLQDSHLRVFENFRV